MHTLILNGSPRQNGDTKAMINCLAKQLGGTITIIDVYKEHFTACTDCRYCWTVRGCAFKDDLDKTYDLLDTVDNLVIASPLYFSELTGPLLSYVSRFQRYYAERYIMTDRPFKMKQKKGAILLAAGGSTKHFENPIETATLILKHVNADPIATLIARTTDHIPAEVDETLKGDLVALAEKLNAENY